MKCVYSQSEKRVWRAISWAFVLTSVIFIVEAVGGWWTGSLALIADAAHMAIDMAGLGLSLGAAWVGGFPADQKRTFGYRRVEVLAAFGNGLILWFASGVILREAYLRYFSPRPILAGPMMAIAALGFFCNLISGSLLYGSSGGNINLQGALFNVSADALGSLGALIAAYVIRLTGWYKTDVVASALICIGIIATSIWLLKDSIHILLEGAPAHLNLDEIRAALKAIEGVSDVHDLHLWSLTSGAESMSGHLVLRSGAEAARVLEEGQKMLKEKFGIEHVTLQIEQPSDSGASEERA